MLLNKQSISPISLAQMLEARDKRVARQRELLQKFNSALLSVTLVTPGEVKRSEITAAIANVLIQELDRLIAYHQWPVLFNQSFDLVTGYEQMVVLEVDALALKRQLVDLEEQHPLGRLWDLDVIAGDGSPISRQQLGFSARRCLLCEESAHICARSRQHSVAELNKHITYLAKQYGLSALS